MVRQSRRDIKFRGKEIALTNNENEAVKERKHLVYDRKDNKKKHDTYK